MVPGRFFPMVAILAGCSRESLDAGQRTNSGTPRGGRGTQIAVSGWIEYAQEG